MNIYIYISSRDKILETTRAADANTNNSNLYLYYPTLYKGFIEAKLPTKNNF